MPLSFIKNRTYFSLIFLAFLTLDILVKTTQDIYIYRFFSKIFLSVLLIIYYLFNQKEVSIIKKIIMVSALMFFLLGDVFFILNKIETCFILGILSFAIGKLLYTFRFSNQEDFKLTQLVPILVFCVLVMLSIFYFISDNLNDYFFISLAYIFVDMLFIIFTFLRKYSVNKKSFYLVFTGAILSLFSDNIVALSSFYSNNIPYEGIGVMLFYGVSQLLIVLGVVREKNFKCDEILVT